MSKVERKGGIFIPKSGEKEGRHGAREAGPQKGSGGTSNNDERSCHFYEWGV
jgi:hypothetical protein